MEHLLQKSKCFIFHNIFKYMIFQRCQKALLWGKFAGIVEVLNTYENNMDNGAFALFGANAPFFIIFSNT